MTHKKIHFARRVWVIGSYFLKSFFIELMPARLWKESIIWIFSENWVTELAQLFVVKEQKDSECSISSNNCFNSYRVTASTNSE